jgi:NADPH:quinone reductase-like Zn-dependent oxidoreductase
MLQESCQRTFPLPLQAAAHAPRQGFEFINAGLASGKLKPVIAKTVPLEELVEAHRFMKSNH